MTLPTNTAFLAKVLDHLEAACEMKKRFADMRKDSPEDWSELEEAILTVARHKRQAYERALEGAQVNPYAIWPADLLDASNILGKLRIPLTEIVMHPQEAPQEAAPAVPRQVVQATLF